MSTSHRTTFAVMAAAIAAAAWLAAVPAVQAAEPVTPAARPVAQRAAAPAPAVEPQGVQRVVVVGRRATLRPAPQGGAAQAPLQLTSLGGTTAATAPLLPPPAPHPGLQTGR